MSKIMNIPYHNNFMECVRQLAVKNIKELISDFVNDLKKLSDKNSDALVDYYIDEYISKWEEKV